MLVLLPQGARTTFDKRTHRKVMIRTTRLMYSFFAGQLLQGREPEEIAEDVLNHLERAQETIKLSLGITEWNRLAGSSMADLGETALRGFEKALDAQPVDVFQQPMQNLPESIRHQIVNELGRQALTTIYRQLLLGVIGELWVEYLTQMEALRVSIGLEAYAQRDPLVQYKNKASALFQELLGNMRLGVISRMFTFRLREPSAAQSAAVRTQSSIDESSKIDVPVETTVNKTQAIKSDEASNKKRRRRKRR